METVDIPDTQPNLWLPIVDRRQLACLGKLGEELGELVAAKDRMVIQGVDGYVPEAGKPNLLVLADELADVLAMAELTIQEFNLNLPAIRERRERKLQFKQRWLDNISIYEAANKAQP